KHTRTRIRATETATSPARPGRRVVLPVDLCDRIGMRPRSVATVLAAGAVLLSTGPRAGGAQRAIAFTRVAVIDGTDSMPRLEQTVIVRGNRIVALGPTKSTAVPSDARVIDARGKFLIPGLWYMHVHTSI